MLSSPTALLAPSAVFGSVPPLRAAAAEPPAAAVTRAPIDLSPAALCELPLFSTLPPARVASLLARATVRHFRRGERVVEQGRSSDTLHVLLSGKAHAVRTGHNGRALLLQVLRRGDFFGELGVLDGLPHGGSVRCLVQCEVLMLSGRDIDQQLRDWPEFAQAMVQVLVQRLRSANRRIASLALHDVHDRVIDYLREHGEPCGDGAFHARGRVSRTEMALMVGASREMVCRVMRQLSRRGIAEALDDGSIIVRPPAEG
ncbi:Crp/Fnr family transcriptional regulator [Ideonella sp. DXS22W]|uniref:Crp/Fnr family transcriptional regulator n=1 Tax=Pseudaquabacterium inlustre TaxID=2984192 RepID=A0ABU9CFB1_9BURK